MMEAFVKESAEWFDRLLRLRFCLRSLLSVLKIFLMDLSLVFK